MKRLDLTDKRFGSLTPAEWLGNSRWRCKCVCGNETVVSTNNLVRHHTRSCGCLRAEKNRAIHRQDLSGQRFGCLEVIADTGKTVNKPNHKSAIWICQCDCGKIIEISSQYLKGGQKSCGCRESNKREGNPNWRGGRGMNKDGYIYVHDPEHPNATKAGRIFEHVKVMSNHIGRPLKPKETVHHRNGVRNDNRIENLELWSSSHPSGQRIVDKVEWAKEILGTYEPTALSNS